ncbi:MAG TPA: hypothetical protein VFT22_30830 [Kofleriaceae bacterium]|nr:hypothetical protein [Kofleriaceae bacterium]
MRCLLVLLCSPLFAAAVAWSLLAACLDGPPDPGPVVARFVAAWDPLGCGAPHRVVLELEDETGAQRSVSAPCNLGGLTVDVPHLGSYQGRIYAWALDAPVRSVMPVVVAIDQPIVHWFVDTPQ